MTSIPLTVKEIFKDNKIDQKNRSYTRPQLSQDRRSASLAPPISRHTSSGVDLSPRYRSASLASPTTVLCSHMSPPPSSDVNKAAFVCFDKLQLGQFVYVTCIDVANPLPFVLGFNPFPCFRPCVGNPTLLLQPLFPTQHHPFTLSSSKSKTFFDCNMHQKPCHGDGMIACSIYDAYSYIYMHVDKEDSDEENGEKDNDEEDNNEDDGDDVSGFVQVEINPKFVDKDEKQKATPSFSIFSIIQTEDEHGHNETLCEGWGANIDSDEYEGLRG
ncbi:hypothetical protein Fmac_011521 [Flemingia macrophylla]|uniref:DUF936 domain-containing protein n=1 Tax=Flemingia macrophylla TaxID=520843 RepID=A0ABD1MMP8_9FABA